MLTNAFVVERPDGEVIGYNCRVTRQKQADRKSK